MSETGASGFHALEGGGVVGDFFAVDDGFASARDRIGVVKADAQGVHVGLFTRVDATGFVKVEADGFGIRRFEEHARAIAHDAVMGEGEFATGFVVHGDHFVGCAGEDPFFQHSAACEQTVLRGKVDGPLAHVGLALPGADEGFHPLEFRGGRFLCGRLLGVEADGTGEEYCDAE